MRACRCRWREFGVRDNGAFKGVRQCKWKPSQKDAFVASQRKSVHKMIKEYDDYDGGDANLWNEVNMYVGPHGEEKEVMWRNLAGLLFVRGPSGVIGGYGGQQSMGNDEDRERLRKLRDHWRSLGKEVPIYELTMEKWAEAAHWDMEKRIDLGDAPFNLAYMELPEGEQEPQGG